MAEYTDAEIERMARAGAAADLSKPFSMEADMQAARWALRYPDAYLPAFATAVLAERAKIDAERTPAPSVAEHHGAGMRCPAAAEPVFPRPPRDEAEREACDNFDGAWCFAEGEDAYCTRRDGHNGNHVGSDGDGAILAVWPATPAGPAPVVPSPLTERLAEALEIVDGAAELLDEQGLGHRLDRVRALLAEYDATRAAPPVTEAREPAPDLDDGPVVPDHPDYFSPEARERAQRAVAIMHGGEPAPTPATQGATAGLRFVAEQWLAWVETHPHRSGPDEALMTSIRQWLGTAPTPPDEVRGLLARCPNCHGKGEIDIGCRYCGDGTYEHHCETWMRPCPICKWVRDALAAACGSKEPG